MEFNNTVLAVYTSVHLVLYVVPTIVVLLDKLTSFIQSGSPEVHSTPLFKYVPSAVKAVL